MSTSPVEFIASSQSQHLWPLIRDQFSQAPRLDIASAFFTAADELLELTRVEETTTRLLVSDRYPTDPDALALCQDGGDVEVRIACSERPGAFHEKLFLARRADGVPAAAYLGSANWTHGGLTRNTEAGVLIRDGVLLKAMSDHFDRGFGAGEPLSDDHLVSLREQHARQRIAMLGGKRDRGKMRSRWRTASGRFILKQNGVTENPFWEGSDSFRQRFGGRLTGGQTLSRCPTTFSNGQGMIVTHIARRKDGSPDRLIYGRGIVAGIDFEGSRLPAAYEAELRRRVLPAEADFICRWPFVVWLDPVEYVRYPEDCSRYLWASELLGVSWFMGGYQFVDDDGWEHVNSALDAAMEVHGTAIVEPDGLWWNARLQVGPDDPLYATRTILEEWNRS